MQISISPVQFPNGWKGFVSPHTETFPIRALTQACDLIFRWRQVFPTGETWVGAQFGVPSLIIRLDCVVLPDDTLHVYEIEDRPSGIGITTEINPLFKEHVSNLRRVWPGFRWVQSPERVTDDDMWLGPGLTLSEALESNDLVIVRARPEHDQYHALEPRSVSTVRHEGDKQYGVELGLWRKLRWEANGTSTTGYIPDLPAISVIKPSQGTRARSVKVGVMKGVSTDSLTARPDDFIAPQKVANLARNGGYVVQPFIPPMKGPHDPSSNMIYRLYFGFDPRSNGYAPLGGVWAAAPSLIVHGTPETVCGPLHF